jgi:hypothetical protein
MVLMLMLLLLECHWNIPLDISLSHGLEIIHSLAWLGNRRERIGFRMIFLVIIKWHRQFKHGDENITLKHDVDS